MPAEPKIRIDEAAGVVYIGDIALDLVLLRRMADPDKRALWRFSRENGRIVARAYSEDQVIWTDEGEALPIVVGRRSKPPVAAPAR